MSGNKSCMTGRASAAHHDFKAFAQCFLSRNLKRFLPCRV